MTGEQVAEGEFMVAILEVDWLRQEVPVGQLLSARCAISAVSGNRLLRRQSAHEAHIESVQGNHAGQLGDADLQTPRKESTSGIRRGSVAHKWRGFDDDV